MKNVAALLLLPCNNCTWVGYNTRNNTSYWPPYLSEVPWMVLVEVDSVVVLSTGVSAAAGMLAVLADAAVAMRHVAAQLPGLALVCGALTCTRKNSTKSHPRSRVLQRGFKRQTTTRNTHSTALVAILLRFLKKCCKHGARTAEHYYQLLQDFFA